MKGNLSIVLQITEVIEEVLSYVHTFFIQNSVIFVSKRFYKVGLDFCGKKRSCRSRRKNVSRNYCLSVLCECGYDLRDVLDTALKFKMFGREKRVLRYLWKSVLLSGRLDLVKSSWILPNYSIDEDSDEILEIDGLSPLIISCRKGNLGVVDYLLNFERDIEEYYPVYLRTASCCGKLDLVKYFVEKGHELDFQDELGETPLMGACSYGHLDIVKYLIEKGASIDKVDDDGNTPLLQATSSRELEIMKYLLDKGANIEEHDYYGNTPLIKACRGGTLKIVKYLVESKGADMEAVNRDGETPLICASKNKHLRVITYLIEKGASVGIEEQENCSLLLLEGASEDLDLIRHFLLEGADIKEGNHSEETLMLLESLQSRFDDILNRMSQIPGFKHISSP
eukprot:TRINITY_DN1313_c0_g1_i2.p1 TRINITY_DN1313_c0_g1~~TRINITY_DN1313_c0_g1_i2.p1  ORF type:complete len:396 (-),score=91.02 TRINITY_DN1313_c0_g1_i2:88-1275(-)